MNFKKIGDEAGKTFVAAESEVNKEESVEDRLARLSEEILKSEAPGGYGNFQAMMYNKCRHLLFQILVENYNRIETQHKLFSEEAEFGSLVIDGWKFYGMRKKGTACVEHGISRVVLSNGNIQVGINKNALK